MMVVHLSFKGKYFFILAESLECTLKLRHLFLLPLQEICIASATSICEADAHCSVTTAWKPHSSFSLRPRRTTRLFVLLQVVVTSACFQVAQVRKKRNGEGTDDGGTTQEVRQRRNRFFSVSDGCAAQHSVQNIIWFSSVCFLLPRGSGPAFDVSVV